MKCVGQVPLNERHSNLNGKRAFFSAILGTSGFFLSLATEIGAESKMEKKAHSPSGFTHSFNLDVNMKQSNNTTVQYLGKSGE